jgi:hypothetical protein
VRVRTRYPTTKELAPSSIKYLPTHLPYNCTFKHNQHKQREQAKIPILVQTPKRNAEDLEYEKWRRGMFAEQLRE